MSDPSQIFIRSWNIYSKVIAANYMKHRELGVCSQKFLKAFSSKTPLRVLDIGCGDAKQLAGQLSMLTIESYTGYDLSEDAIALAKQHLAPTGANLTFRIGSMEELIQAEPSTFNLIYSSFAIHHLQDPEKQLFIADCYRVLEQGGIFILIDVKRLPGQSREEYNKSYVDWIHQDWNVLDQDEKEAVAAHLTTCDFPVETSSYVQMATAAGFKLLEEVDIDPRHGLLVFGKD
jgi:ubiquinone/menaquinone biosynthesis C-methylase UbiE